MCSRMYSKPLASQYFTFRSLVCLHFAGKRDISWHMGGKLFELQGKFGMESVGCHSHFPLLYDGWQKGSYERVHNLFSYPGSFWIDLPSFDLDLIKLRCIAITIGCSWRACFLCSAHSLLSFLYNPWPYLTLTWTPLISRQGRHLLLALIERFVVVVVVEFVRRWELCSCDHVYDISNAFDLDNVNLDLHFFCYCFTPTDTEAY
jgi:hypothetical protein